MPALPFEITPIEVKRSLDAGEKMSLIDVREPFEFEQARIEGARLVPMRTIAESLPSLEEESERATLIVLCHHGMRSLNVVDWLRRQGVEACMSMQGGIDRWSLEIDPAVPRY